MAFIDRRHSDHPSCIGLHLYDPTMVTNRDKLLLHELFSSEIMKTTESNVTDVGLDKAHQACSHLIFSLFTT